MTQIQIFGECENQRMRSKMWNGKWHKMAPWSPPSYDVKIIGGRKVIDNDDGDDDDDANWQPGQVIIWDEPKEKKKPVFVPAIKR